MQTEHPFVLPRGYLAPDGAVHREGTLRLARAGDEIAVLDDPRVQANRAWAVVDLLARVITRLGPLEGDEIDADVVAELFSSDFAYLQARYRELNGVDPSC